MNKALVVLCVLAFGCAEEDSEFEAEDRTLQGPFKSTGEGKGGAGSGGQTGAQTSTNPNGWTMEDSDAGIDFPTPGCIRKFHNDPVCGGDEHSALVDFCVEHDDDDENDLVMIRERYTQPAGCVQMWGNHTMVQQKDCRTFCNDPTATCEYAFVPGCGNQLPPGGGTGGDDGGWPGDDPDAGGGQALATGDWAAYCRCPNGAPE